MQRLSIRTESIPSPEADTPPRFLTELFRRACDVDASRANITDEVTTPDQEQIVRGFHGTAQIGYRWSESRSLETSAVPLSIEVETYGIPGMQVVWHYRLDKDGQWGHSRYRHQRLRVEFEDESRRAVFVDAWRVVFRQEPVFVDETG